MELGDDDWNFSQEELDTLERDALRIVAERKSSSATASISSSSQESYFNKVPNLPPSSIRNTQVGVITAKDNAKELQKVCIKLILHSSGKIAAKFTYNEIVVSAFRSIPQAWWSGKERLWMFPMSSLSSVEKILSEIKGISVELEKLDPLVRRAIVAASAVPDLRECQALSNQSFCHFSEMESSLCCSMEGAFSWLMRWASGRLCRNGIHQPGSILLIEYFLFLRV